jgi:hypothetical protein
MRRNNGKTERDRVALLLDDPHKGEMVKAKEEEIKKYKEWARQSV